MPHRKPPVSAIQLVANRPNAGKSTGPRTSQGKARSAQNARKHGFTASTFAVVRLEDLDSTGNPMLLMSAELAGDDDIEITRAQNRNYALAEGFRRCVDQSNRRAIEEFERLKALRQELPNEPILDPNPNKTQPLAPQENEPVSDGNPAVGTEGGGPQGGGPPGPPRWGETEMRPESVGRLPWRRAKETGTKAIWRKPWLSSARCDGRRGVARRSRLLLAAARANGRIAGVGMERTVPHGAELARAQVGSDTIDSEA